MGQHIANGKLVGLIDSMCLEGLTLRKRLGIPPANRSQNVHLLSLVCLEDDCLHVSRSTLDPSESFKDPPLAHLGCSQCLCVGYSPGSGTGFAI